MKPCMRCQEPTAVRYDSPLGYWVGVCESCRHPGTEWDEPQPCTECSFPTSRAIKRGKPKQGRRFCSEACSSRFYRRKKSTRTAPCAQCGEEFVSRRSDARFCSNRCRTAAHRSTHAKEGAHVIQ